MEELERLQLNIQLPAGALEGFTRLAEQLRLLAEALGGGGQMPASLQTARTVPLERGENTAFDLERFREMANLLSACRRVEINPYFSQSSNLSRSSAST